MIWRIGARLIWPSSFPKASNHHSRLSFKNKRIFLDGRWCCVLFTQSRTLRQSVSPRATYFWPAHPQGRQHWPITFLDIKKNNEEKMQSDHASLDFSNAANEDRHDHQDEERESIDQNGFHIARGHNLHSKSHFQLYTY
jgi:hypothetical protein